jgi:hypothetical protein
MIWTKQHIKDFFKAQGHDPDEVLTRLAARDSIKHDLEAWAILREWYDKHPRMSKDIISEVLDLPPDKTRRGLIFGRQYLIS